MRRAGTQPRSLAKYSSGKTYPCAHANADSSLKSFRAASAASCIRSVTWPADDLSGPANTSIAQVRGGRVSASVSVPARHASRLVLPLPLFKTRLTASASGRLDRPARVDPSAALTMMSVFTLSLSTGWALRVSFVCVRLLTWFVSTWCGRLPGPGDGLHHLDSGAG